ncbi:EGF domain-specific O-linked N-acetylglucosamine transferase [Toxorhynchites rutilus septentrionalis]|uniref:EGF domain-specific O-linked N-acetylglucosamine transferase n=1 Tax=Toxorhynchites rutilus septentrionalis TaxID=329112 RepID=UPI00247ADE1E|nr:EGF domain-specific O-linked N-acetylglucosamine transferase [Toxorhynchites rutilus septentrionalis]
MITPKPSLILIVGIISCDIIGSVSEYEFINLPKSHLPLYFRRYPQLAKKCLNDDRCEYRSVINSETFKARQHICWGYESDCEPNNRFSQLKCPGNYKGYVKTKEAQIETYYAQADFGFIRDQIREMRIMCEPRFPHDSALECSKYLRFCRGRNIMVNFTDLVHRREPLRYKMDILSQGQIGGHCKLHRQRLEDELEHISPLQSWGPELRFFDTLSQPLAESGHCDITIEKPAFIMKIDATINMYHHFCDFLNLYGSLHANLSDPTGFTTDVHILVWESYTYSSPFAETFKAFTKHPIADLKTYAGKVVCFKNLVLPLLPRMIFGLYYNTPIISGCENSGLFQAFSEHILHRLRISLKSHTQRKVRITFLSRQTKYRTVLNEDELLEEISDNERYIVNRVSFNYKMPFREQLKITRNTDVFIGMHGAGLTHLLFLPKWAVLFELYHCEDPNCYKDLARLKGVRYMTWENDELVYPEDEGHHPDGGGRHAKFTNYAFDRKEFARLVANAADHVLKHEDFLHFLERSQNKKDNTAPKEEL